MSTVPVRYRGLDPRHSRALWAATAIISGIVVGLTGPAAVRALLEAAAIQHDKLPWYATRVFAFLSYLAIAGSVVYGLLLSTKLLDAIAHRPISVALHQDLASVGLGLGMIHAMLLTLDRTMPFTLAQVLVPFAAPYRPVWVGIGQLAGYLVIVVVASFYLRRRIGQRAWRLLHVTTFAAFAGSAAHGLLSGTDSSTPWAWAIYAGSTALVVFLTAYRVVVSLAARHHRAPAGTGAPARSARASDDAAVTTALQVGAGRAQRGGNRPG